MVPGQSVAATVAELLAIPRCREVVMVTRKSIAARSRVRNVVLDTAAADFAERTAALAREVLSQGPVSAVSCVGVGSGSMRWSEEELRRLEFGVVHCLMPRGCHDAGIARFCLLSAVGSSARSRFRYARVMGMKESTCAQHRFYPPRHLSLFYHCSAMLIHRSGPFGWEALCLGGLAVVDQRILGRSIAVG